MSVPMVETEIAEQWTLLLPEHRAVRPEWPWWERARLESIHAHIRPGDTIIDVGAEEGDMAALFAQWGAEVALAEPNPLVWPNIRAIFEANQLAQPVIKWVGFCGEEPRAVGVQPIAEDGWPECAHGPVIGDHGFMQLNERPDIPVTTVDHIAAAAGGCAHLTMDVEGSELEVLLGARATLLGERPLVWVSVHPDFMEKQYHHSPAELHAYMAALGYAGEMLDDAHEQHWLFRPLENWKWMP